MDNLGLKKDAKAFGRWSVLFFFLIILGDQLSKHFAWHIFQNRVFAFSLQLPVWLIYIIYATVLGAISCYVWKHHETLSPTARLAWLLILAGALCNVLERLVLGYVRDFIYITFYKWTGVYNLADFYIILGIILLVFLPKQYGQNGKPDSTDDIKNF